MKVIFLGTNGWYSTKAGNTACVLLDTEKYYILLDAGDGIQKLEKYTTEDKPIYMFLSHFHLDHIIGFHILDKFKSLREIRMYGQKGLKDVVKTLIGSPFTNSIENLPYKVEVFELEEGRHELPFPVTCKSLVHRDPVFGYKIEIDGKVIAYCTDTGPCDNQIDLAKGADLFISECALKSGQQKEWPHMNPELAAEVANSANVKQLALFHFDAEVYETLEERKEAESVAKKIFPNTVASVDGLELEL